MSSRGPERSLGDEVLLAIAPTIAHELLVAARGILRREHEAWMARRDAPQPRRRAR